MNSPTPFHRLLGLSWKDFFDGTDVEVVTEIDLSIKQQLLDIVLIRKRAGPLLRRLPDGFDLAVYNLITFKSYQEALDDWALIELVGHYVNYRKQCSPLKKKRGQASIKENKEKGQEKKGQAWTGLVSPSHGRRRGWFQGAPPPN